MEKKEWCEKLVKLIRARTGNLFELGDHINAGLDDYGEAYVAVQANVGYELASLYNIASVCRRIPVKRRRKELSFGHHEAVSSLSSGDQEAFLQAAVEKTLSVADLRQAIRSGMADEQSKAPKERSEMIAWLANGVRLLTIESRTTWTNERREAFRTYWEKLEGLAAKILGASGGPPP